MLKPWFRNRREDRATRRQQERRRRFSVESLEGRQMLSTFTVTNSNDYAAGSLRHAIVSSNATPGPNVINFNIPGSGVHTINLLSALPALTQPVTIDGTTEPNSGGQPVIQVDGTKAGSGVVGLDLPAAASGSTIKGLAVTDFSGGGVLLNGASNVSITNDDIGLVKLGTGVVVHANTGFGVQLENGANHNTLSGDVVSGQSGTGVAIIGTGTNTNTVQNSEIGTNPTGTSKLDQNGASLANSGSGVIIDGGASHNTLTGDVISNNANDGVLISDSGTTGNVVQGSDIGADSTGSNALPNTDGLAIQNGATNNTVGGTTSAARNVISGNSWDGVHIVNSGTTGNVVEGGFLGVTASGSAALGNGASDVAVFAGASNNEIGGTVTGSGNVISAGGVYGVYISDSGTTDNVVEGDDIGTDSTGLHALGNGSDGVLIQAGATNNTVGGTTSAARNVISSNASDGVRITGADTNNNVVEGAYIGVDATGGVPLGNGGYGVQIDNGASNNTVGGTTTGSRNVISANGCSGVLIGSIGTTGNVVEGNDLGTDSTGEYRVGNHIDGVDLVNGASFNIIGGTSTTARNVISANSYEGIWITGTGTSNNLIEGNDIGTDAYGEVGLGNAINGIQIDSGASANVIGGSNTNALNLIEYNGGNGVGLGSGSFANTMQNDIISLNGANGVWFAGASGNSVVGCTIEANQQWGILDQGSDNYYADNTIYNNLDGTIGY